MNPLPVDLDIHPTTRNTSLRAWDAADEYLLEAVAACERAPELPVLVVNDTHGALALSLHSRLSCAVTSWSDSWSAHRSARLNAVSNGFALDSLTPLPSTESPAGPWGVVLLKVPKSLAMLEAQLAALRPHLTGDTVFIAAGMVRHIHTSTLDLFARIIGSTTTSLAKKKARLIQPELDPSLAIPSPAAIERTEENGVRLVEHANVFARGKLDIGTRALLDHLPAVPDGADVVDLGCGNGILGLTLARSLDTGSMTFVDHSYQAVASAEAAWHANQFDRGSVHAEFVVGDGLESRAGESVDVIVNNPPFHDDQRLSDDTAWRMFAQSHRSLRPGGEFRVVANRHLGHHAKMAKLFGNCETVGATKKFVVLRSRRD